MKKLFRALSLCLTLALCVFCSTAALAEAPAATPAPQDERVITDVSPLEDQIRNIVGFTTSTGGPYDFEQADHKSAVQAYGAEPAEGAVALLRIYARAEDRGDASINSSGHSFLSVRNVSDHDIEVGGLRIAPDTEMTFSPRGNRWEHTGIWYNLEGYYKRYLADSYYQNIYAVQTSLDQGQLDVVNRNLAKSDHWSAYFRLYREHVERCLRRHSFRRAALHPGEPAERHSGQVRCSGRVQPPGPLRLHCLLRHQPDPQQRVCLIFRFVGYNILIFTSFRAIMGVFESTRQGRTP